MKTKLFRVSFMRTYELYVEAEDESTAEEATSENIDEWFADGGIPDVCETSNAVEVTDAGMLPQTWKGAFPYRDGWIRRQNRDTPERTCEQVIADAVAVERVRR